MNQGMKLGGFDRSAGFLPKFGELKLLPVTTPTPAGGPTESAVTSVTTTE